MALEHEITAISVTVPDIPQGRLMFEGVDMANGPTFSTSTVSKVFFARTGYWLRWRERIGSTVLDGVPVQPGRSASHIRQFTLADIERIAYALREDDVLTLEQLVKTLRALAAVGRIHDLII